MHDTPAAPPAVFSADAVESACTSFYGTPWLSYPDQYRDNQREQMARALKTADMVRRLDDARLLNDILDHATVRPGPAPAVVKQSLTTAPATTEESSGVAPAARTTLCGMCSVEFPTPAEPHCYCPACTRADSDRISNMQSEYWSVTSFATPTGMGDYSVGWRVTQDLGGSKGETVIAEVFNDDVRDALDLAANIGDAWPECSGDPSCCPENEGHGCCRPTPPSAQPVSNADELPRSGDAPVAMEFTEERRRAYAPASEAGPEDMAVYNRIAQRHFDSFAPAIPATSGAHCIPRDFSDGSAAPVTAPAQAPRAHYDASVPQAVRDEAAQAYLRDWVPDHVRDYVTRLSAPADARDAESDAELIETLRIDNNELRDLARRHERNARRYKWLRNPDCKTARVIIDLDPQCSALADGEGLDQHIDSAMGAEGGSQ